MNRILSKLFILEVRSETLDGPFEINLQDSQGVGIYTILGCPNLKEGLKDVKEIMNTILTRQGVSKLLDHYPAEIIVKKYIGTTMPNISKFLFTGLNVGMQI